ncbi:MAG: DciA family protein [Dermatophilaceae bacterium]
MIETPSPDTEHGALEPPRPEPPGGKSPVAEEPGPEEPDERERLALAAAAALARARESARARGLRPGAGRGRSHRQGIPGTSRGREATYSSSGRDGRDPVTLGDQLDHLVVDRGWSDDVAVGAVISRWPATVGPEVAQHARPESFEDGVLSVQADSTAWATNLRFLSEGILAKIAIDTGEGVVTELRILGPSAPSWRRGRRSASGGRGPRDTYG